MDQIWETWCAVRAIKKITQNDYGPGPSLNYGEMAIFTLSQKVFFGKKKRFIPKKHPKFFKRLTFILENSTFFVEQLFPVVARTWLGSRSERFFLGPKSRFLAKKSNFCHTTPILVNGPFVALGVTVNFPPWDRFFDFLFPRYSSFPKKNLVDSSKSLPPPHCGGTVCQ